MIFVNIVYKRFPQMINMLNYSKSNVTARRVENLNLLQAKCLSKMKCAISPADIKTIASMGPGVNEVLIDVIRDLKQKMDAFQPRYNAKMKSRKTTDQKMREEDRRKGGDGTSNYSISTVRSEMHRVSSGISPPQILKVLSDEEINSKPSLMAASIAASLDGNKRAEVVLGSAGRRAQERMRRAAREKSAKHLRNSPKSRVAREGAQVSEEDMNSMFEKITTRLYTELDKHMEIIDKLDTQSKDFDQQMTYLKDANLKELDKTDKALAVDLRSDSSNPDLDSATLAAHVTAVMPIRAPDVDGAPNTNFLFSADPYSDKLVEVDWDGGAAEPPPPSGAPPAHILAKMKKAEKGYDENQRLFDEEGNPYPTDSEEEEEEEEEEEKEEENDEEFYDA